MKRISFLILPLCLSLAHVAVAQDITRPQPEIATGFAAETQTAQATKAMAVTANPFATRAAQDVLNKGGSAADALIAAQAVLGLTEPQSSGLGGGAFALYYDAKSKTLSSYDARETAPQRDGPDLFLRKDGSPQGFYEGVIGGKSVGVPGTPRLLEKLHADHGMLEWKGLFDPALHLAREGFPVSPRLAAMVREAFANLRGSPAARAYFVPEGKMVTEGHILKNPAYAASMQILADQGADPFYEGVQARTLATAVQSAYPNPGSMTLSDLAGYEVKMRDPVCATYRSYKVCGMGEPSSGGLTTLQMLKLLEQFDMGHAPSAANLHLFAEAQRLAFADRNLYMADPDFVKTPNTALLDENYIGARSQLIREGSRMQNVEAGTPPDWNAPREDPVSPPEKGTSHMVMADRYGNVASMTTTIETAFGSRVMANGYLLNNELTDFSFLPEKDGKLIANRVEGGKRPRSSMSPTIVFNAAGEPVLAVGSAGGARIIPFVALRLIAYIDWKMNAEELMRLPNVVSEEGGIVTEEGFSRFVSPLNQLGHPVAIEEIGSGLTVLEIGKEGLTGAADPRREGTAAGVN
ncbi:MAG: gamma-glutamyltransferase [Pseudobdellovibrionaceae bacterium]